MKILQSLAFLFVDISKRLYAEFVALQEPYAYNKTMDKFNLTEQLKLNFPPFLA